MVWLNRWRDPLRLFGLLAFLAAIIVLMLTFTGAIQLQNMTAIAILIGGLLGLELTV